ncbi:precorrin-3B C(17)-methyltransferase [cyanobiont of Ornithocercus magnificus]|nr:precorrin-3B C(17)-methyltransferase [cyanobiont of Ornithocercus magnificus]
MLRLALGLSASSWPLLLRLKRNGHVDQLALTPAAAETLTAHIGSLAQETLLIARGAEVFKQHWQKDGIFIVVGAIGAVTRLIAPMVTDKECDPAVLVVDARGDVVIPLLGGHWAGAEHLALELAAELGGQAGITGDCTVSAKTSWDCFGKLWGWRRSGKGNCWNALMRRQATARLPVVQQESGSNLWQAAVNFQKLQCNRATTPDLLIGPGLNAPCCWHPATLWLGIGCERNTSFSLLKRAVSEALEVGQLAIEAVAGLASIDLKANEPGLLELVQANGWFLRLYKASELATVDVPTPSASVALKIGTPSVAEAAALRAAGTGANLKLTKRIQRAQDGEHGTATIAVASAVRAFAPERGELHLVSSGPGDQALLTHDARAALIRCPVWFGYSFYLDLLEPLRRQDQVRCDSNLTQEIDRCQQAIDLATEGVRVALVSSGDSGIYGMAGLALDLWLRQPSQERPSFQVHPGVSALQLAAARVGAPLMHDFCTVSLSDRLTPWDVIESRVRAAAEGDFVVAFYNPRSRDRNWQLSRAINLLLEHRPMSTPAVIARQLGRQGEKISLHRLSDIPIEDVDMFSLVLVGNSTSQIHGNWMLTPRGYSSRGKLA